MKIQHRHRDVNGFAFKGRETEHLKPENSNKPLMNISFHNIWPHFTRMSEYSDLWPSLDPWYAHLSILSCYCYTHCPKNSQPIKSYSGDTGQITPVDDVKQLSWGLSQNRPPKLLHFGVNSVWQKHLLSRWRYLITPYSYQVRNLITSFANKLLLIWSSARTQEHHYTRDVTANVRPVSLVSACLAK